MNQFTEYDNLIKDVITLRDKRFDELVYLFLYDEYRVTQRAGWPMSYIASAHPQLVKKHLAKLIAHLQNHKLHDTVKRNTVRLLQFVEMLLQYESKEKASEE